MAMYAGWPGLIKRHASSLFAIGILVLYANLKIGVEVATIISMLAFDLHQSLAIYIVIICKASLQLTKFHKYGIRF